MPERIAPPSPFVVTHKVHQQAKDGSLGNGRWLLTKAEVCRLTGMSERTVDRKVADQLMPGPVHIGQPNGRPLWIVEELAAFVNKLRERPTAKELKQWVREECLSHTKRSPAY